MNLFKMLFNKDSKKTDNQELNSAEFKKLVCKHFAPFLRENGWKGTGFVYRRFKSNNIIEVLEFSPYRYGGKFGIELGVHFDFIELPWIKDFAKIRTRHLDIRSDIGKNNEQYTHWYYPNTDAKLSALFTELKHLYKNKAESFFSLFNNWEEELTKITENQIEDGELKIPFFTKLRAALVISKLQEYQGNFDQAKKIAQYGLSKIDGPNGSALSDDFEKIITAANNA